jgi:transcriptional regulator with XRE-family HTH domain
MEPDLARSVLNALTLSLREIANELGVSHDTVKSWSAGRRSPSRAHLARLADMLETRSGDLQDHADALRAALEGGNDG